MARAVAAALLAALLVAGGAGAATRVPRSGGTLVTSGPAFVCLNVFAPCGVFRAHPALTQVLEGAFEVGPDLVYRPNLVSRVEISRQPLALTYHIRPQARWSDGVPVTSRDFEFTYRAFLTQRTSFGDERELYGKIRRARALGPKRFRVELRERTADWRDLFRLVLPRHVLAGEDLTAVWRDRIDDPRTGRPIGNGPFLTQRLEAGRQLTLVRNPRYWGPHRAYLDRWILRFAPADAADPLGQLRRNEIDFTATVPGIPAPLTAEHAREVRRLRGWRIAAWPGAGREHLAFRLGPGGHPALRSRAVRQALAYGIDRDEIARRVNADLGRRARPLDSSVFLAGQPEYRAHWARYRHDAARARRLLEGAGCRRGVDGVYACAGERLRLRFATTVGRPERELTLRLVQEQLARVGVEVAPLYFAGPIAAFLGRGDWDGALFAWVSDPGGGTMPETRCGDAQNWGGYCSRLAQRDIQQTFLILDPALRARALNAADAKLAADVPVLPLYQGVERVALRAEVRGFVPGGSFINYHENSEDWWLAP